ncbi:MAG: N-formylglutamate deformylase [Pseudomonadota bacterium]
MTRVFALREGDSPLLVSLPHSGTALAHDLEERLTAAAWLLPDTDWHIPRLYGFLEALGATVIEARYSRYVVDLNRPPDGAALYPGKAETALVPTQTFAGEAIYRDGGDGGEPDAAEIAARRARYWQPYHDALGAALERLKARFGYALLWDAHSIASRVPRLFDGRLPDLNIGTADGAACAPALAQAVYDTCADSDFSVVMNGRFKGGYITRHYGRPDDGVHALQMEIAQASYMHEPPPFRFDADRAGRLRPVLERAIDAMVAALA